VGDEGLIAANSLSSLNQNIARLVGPAIGGLIAVSTGLAGVTLVDAGTFVVAALLVAFISIPQEKAASEAHDRDGAPTALWHQWLEGLRLVRGSTALSIMIGIFALTSLGEGVFGTMFVIWVRQVLAGSALQFGWFMSAQAVGGILGGLAVGLLGSRIAPVRLAWIGGSIFALLDIALFNYPLAFPQVWLGLVIMVLVGIPAAAGGSSMRAVLQLATPDSYRGRIFWALGTTMALTRLAGTGIAGTLGGVFGPIPLLTAFQGGAYLLASALILLMSVHLVPAGTEGAEGAARNILAPSTD
jgi:hypothetical protein